VAATSSSTFVIYAALAGNVLVAVSKFGAAAWTGSSAMLSEAVHSTVDCGNQLLMLYGIHRASAPPDEQHPLGYGRELYFWSFIVALLIFSIGAGVSFYEGVNHILTPVPITDPHVSYIVLTLSLLFEGTSWCFAVREFEKQRGGLGFLEAAARSRDPTSFLVLFEDSAALIGIGIAFAGTFAAEWLQNPRLDGVASLGISMVLAVTAAFLAHESKGLLIGEPAREPIRRSIIRIATDHVGISAVGRLVTVHLAPRQIVAALNVDFVDDLRASEVEDVTHSLEQTISQHHPEIVALFLSPKKIALGFSPKVRTRSWASKAKSWKADRST
jgi:cation diffusion facilitator family transporter